jgi:beta-glucosidase
MKTTIVLLYCAPLVPFLGAKAWTLQETEINRKVSELLSKMTVDEKVGQMTQMTVTNFEEKETQAFSTWLS